MRTHNHSGVMAKCDVNACHSVGTTASNTTRPETGGVAPPLLATTADLIESGEDYSVYRTVRETTDENGCVNRTVVGQFTLIGNALNYRHNGVWRRSEDRIERRGRYFVAARGPNKARFTRELKPGATFSIAMSDGSHYEGGVRRLELFNSSTGEVLNLATLRRGVASEFVSSNQLLYREAFDGVAADLLYIWRHDGFYQDIIVRSLPQLPDGWSAGDTELCVVTDVAVDGPVSMTGPSAPDSEKYEGECSTIPLGRMTMIVGRGFSLRDGESLPSRYEDRAGAVPVRKTWNRREDGTYRLTESVPWSAVTNSSPRLQSREAAGGYVIDFIIVPQNQITTFQKGFTYYVQSIYHVTVPIRLEGGTIIKYANSAKIRLSAQSSFPEQPPYALFTSRNDDLYGERILGVPGEDPSDGDPFNHRAETALFVDHVPDAGILRNVRVRWAQICMRFIGIASYITHVVQGSLLEHSDLGILAEVPETSAVGLKDVSMADVITPRSGNGFRETPPDLPEVNASDWPHHQADPAIAVRVPDSRQPHRATVVAVSLSRLANPGVLPDVGILRMMSRDGGKTWGIVGYIATGTDLPRADGDPDPSILYDDFNNLFLAYRASGPHRVVCAMSEDDGVTWRQVNGFEGAELTHFEGATPTLAFARRPGTNFGSLWISLHRNGGHELRCAATEVRGFGWSNVGGPNKWILTGPLPQATNVKFHGIAAGPAGEVMLVVTRGNTPPGYDDAPVRVMTLLNTAGYPSVTFEHIPTADFILTNMGGTFLPGAFVDPLPVLAWDKPRNKVYLTYTSRAPGAPESQTQAVLRRFEWSDPRHWTEELALQTGSTNTQFHPRVIVDQASGHVAAIWYDRKDDPANLQSHLYAAISRTGFDPSETLVTFRASTTPVSHEASHYDLKEFIGLAAGGGFFYPAWVGNGTTFGPAWDVMVARLPF